MGSSLALALILGLLPASSLASWSLCTGGLRARRSNLDRPGLRSLLVTGHRLKPFSNLCRPPWGAPWTEKPKEARGTMHANRSSSFMGVRGRFRRAGKRDCLTPILRLRLRLGSAAVAVPAVAARSGTAPVLGLRLVLGSAAVAVAAVVARSGTAAVGTAGDAPGCAGAS